MFRKILKELFEAFAIVGFLVIVSYWGLKVLVHHELPSTYGALATLVYFAITGKFWYEIFRPS